MLGLRMKEWRQMWWLNSCTDAANDLSLSPSLKLYNPASATVATNKSPPWNCCTEPYYNTLLVAVCGSSSFLLCSYSCSFQRSSITNLLLGPNRVESPISPSIAEQWRQYQQVNVFQEALNLFFDELILIVCS